MTYHNRIHLFQYCHSTRVVSINKKLLKILNIPKTLIMNNKSVTVTVTENLPIQLYKTVFQLILFYPNPLLHQYLWVSMYKASFWDE